MFDRFRNIVFQFLRSDIRFVEIIFFLYSVWTGIVFILPSGTFVGPVYTHTLQYVTQSTAVLYFLAVSVIAFVAMRQRIAVLRKLMLGLGSLTYWVYITFIYRDLGITVTTGLYTILVVAGIFTAWRLTATS